LRCWTKLHIKGKVVDENYIRQSAFHVSLFKVHVAPEVIGVFLVLHAPHRLQRGGIVGNARAAEVANALGGYGASELLPEDATFPKHIRTKVLLRRENSAWRVASKCTQSAPPRYDYEPAAATPSAIFVPRQANICGRCA